MPYSSYSPKQKKLAGLAGNKKKIDRADLIALRTKKGGKKKGRKPVSRKRGKVA